MITLIDMLHRVHLEMHEIVRYLCSISLKIDKHNCFSTMTTLQAAAAAERGRVDIIIELILTAAEVNKPNAKPTELLVRQATDDWVHLRAGKPVINDKLCNSYNSQP